MTRRKKIQDPYAEREASKYANPIPSRREAILEWLGGLEKGLNFNELANGLGLRDEDDLRALRKRLRAMIRDCSLVKVEGGIRS